MNDRTKRFGGGAGRSPLRVILPLALAAIPGCGPLPALRLGSSGSSASTVGRGPPRPWKFAEVGEEAGLAWTHVPFHADGAFDAYDHGNGVAAGDFDGDGHADVLLLSQCGPVGYFLGRGNGRFTDRSERMAALDGGVRVAVACGDFDEDGRTDFYVTFVRRPNALLRQEPDGTFTDVAAERGVALVGHFSGAAFADVDGDGDLDLAVAGNLQYTEPDQPKAADDRCAGGWKGKPVLDLFTVAGSDPSALLINGGAGSGWTFVDEAAARGLPPGAPDGAEARGFGDVAAFDYDRDGDVDLLLPEMFRGKTALLENDGAGRFTDVTALRIPQPSFGSSNAAAEDFNGDGRPDLLMTDMHSDMWAAVDRPITSLETGVRYLGDHGPHSGTGDNPTGPLFGNSLWMGRADGGFDEAGPAWGAETFNPWGALTADFNNDGRVDVFIPSGMSNPWAYYPDVLLENVGDRFLQRQKDLGLDPPPGGEIDSDILVDGYPLVHSTRGSAVADFDEDGDLDIVCCTWRSRPLLWRNDLPRGARWIDVDLRGAAPRDPFGAEVEVVAGATTQVRWMQSSRGYLSQSTRLVHVGLGEERRVDSISVRWPDGTRTRIEHPRVNRTLVVRQ